MTLKDNKEVCFIVVVVSFLMCVVIINMIIDFMWIDAFYLLACVVFIIRYFYLRMTL